MENKVTLEQIESKIKAECYLVLPDGRSTICLLSLENGYTIKGLSSCVDASNFDMETGRKIAREDAVRQIWPLEGYLLAEKLHNKTKTENKTSNTFMLSPLQVAALKKAGYWDDPVKRARMIKKYAEDAGMIKPVNAPQESVDWEDLEKRLEKPKKISQKTSKTKKAPYGYKKDGTPKKRPGRPAKEAA